MQTILKDAKRYGSLRESCLQHGIEHIDEPGYLFPEFKNLNREPEFVGRDMGWVGKVMSGVHRTPFSRIKSLQADITEDEARALGYIKKLKLNCKWLYPAAACCPYFALNAAVYVKNASA